MKRTKWFERKFPPIEDNGQMPSIIERLAGTAAILTEMLAGLDSETLKSKPENRWSIKEEIGHLADLEPLWLGRVDDFLTGETSLRAADLTNRRTHEADHNGSEIGSLLQDFRSQRAIFVSRLRNLPGEAFLKTALHPRLQTPMRVVDHVYFVAEHDAHHLAAIRELLGLIEH